MQSNAIEIALRHGLSAVNLQSKKNQEHEKSKKVQIYQWIYLENAYHYCKNLSFNFEECTRDEEVAQIHKSIENGDDSWLQDDENEEEASQKFEFIEVPSYVALISDD